MYISATRDEGYGTGIQGARKSSVRNIFALSYPWKLKSFPPILEARNILLVKKSELGLHNLVTLAKEKWNNFLRASGKLMIKYGCI